MGSLNDAEEQVFKANSRTVKGAAVETILLNKNASTKDLLYHDVSGTKTAYTKWKATAKVGKNGEVTDLDIEPDATAEKESAEKQTDGTYTVTVNITELKLKS